MKKKLISIICLFGALWCFVLIMSLDVNAEELNNRKVDGSYLTMDDESTGTTNSNRFLRGQYLMDGDSTISKAGRGRIYAYGATTANRDVDFVGIIVYVERYHEETDDWGQIDSWTAEDYNTYYISTSKTLTVDRGYYYRVRSEHVAGNEENRPFDADISYTNGIWIN